MVKPIKPSEIVQKKDFPDEVIESWNEVIAKNFSGSISRFKEKEVVSKILEKFKRKGSEYTASDVYDNRWLDVEELYRGVGWRVDYDKPGFNESYPATYTFEKPKWER